MEHKWIKVEDALPSKKESDHRSKYVLVNVVARDSYHSYTFQEVACYDYKDNEWDLTAKREDMEYGWMTEEEEITYTVTHWMPIPPIEEK